VSGRRATYARCVYRHETVVAGWEKVARSGSVGRVCFRECDCPPPRAAQLRRVTCHMLRRCAVVMHLRLSSSAEMRAKCSLTSRVIGTCACRVIQPRRKSWCAAATCEEAQAYAHAVRQGAAAPATPAVPPPGVRRRCAMLVAEVSSRRRFSRHTPIVFPAARRGLRASRRGVASRRRVTAIEVSFSPAILMP